MPLPDCKEHLITVTGYMSKIKSALDLTDSITEEYKWRFQEIFQLRDVVRSNKNKKAESALAKSLIVISYSHWEGFVKQVSINYMKYVSFKAPNKSQLSTDLLVPLLYNNIPFDNDSIYGNYPKKLEYIKKVLLDNSFKFEIKWDDLCDAKSNLNSDVLIRIATNIGLSVQDMDTKFAFIDGVLLKNRNDFAHGDRNGLKVKDAVDIADSVIDLMNIYKTKIENAVTLKSFIKNP